MKIECTVDELKELVNEKTADTNISADIDKNKLKENELSPHKFPY